MNSVRYFFQVLGNALLNVIGVLGQTFGAVFGWRLFRFRRRRTYYAARRRRLSARTHRILRLSVASLVIIASAAWLYVSWRWQTGPIRDHRTDELLGWGVAEETIRLMTEAGQVVVVAWRPDPLTGGSAAPEVRVQEFLRCVRLRPHVRLRAVERVDPQQFDQEAMQLRGVFPALLKKYPAADLFVSFVGIPDLDTAPLLRDGHRLPKFVVVTSQTPALQTFFDRKLVTVAIVPRGRSILLSHDDVESIPAQFECLFQVVTASNLPAPKLPSPQ